ncbi:hypothetical protein CPB83DRAFT_876289 [Crepidotus variabilis]|uniref:SH3 domain-binding glutamic acid-rich protein n=1 Tax=Crepidotus variabilis TaxID=179855 RepID=A0A9P6JP54_9AGAR|nr:hypothetical protein CPB83DRAFT_876289 [Crepidotus variabilis]
MGPPPISLFMTTIASQISLRQRQEYILRALQVKKIPYVTYDLASDEDAKRLWRRKAPTDKQQLPGFLVGGKFIGTCSDFEDAVEHDELTLFLRQNEEWEADPDRPLPEAKVVGVPGAMTPLEMTPERLKKKIMAQPSPSPLRGLNIGKPTPVNKRTDELDLGEELSGYGLQGVKATEAELRALVEELGLDGDEAGDLVKGLGSLSVTDQKKEKGKPKEETVLDGKSQDSLEASTKVQEVEIPAKTEESGKKGEEPTETSTVTKEDIQVKKEAVPVAMDGRKEE